jgi:asparagine synthase (glutamine-hydrolysing)
VLGPVGRVELDDLDAMTRAIAHRGPDDSGTWSARFAEGDVEHAVGLGHRRLAIIDLSPLGHQPMLSADGGVAIAYNGEIYNFRELRAELVALGHRFRSESDTEVLLEAWRAWGRDAFPRLIGMFALAIWDARARRLVLVRDRLGIKPLYWSFRDGLLLFGSELHALRAHRRFDPAIDRGALGRYLRSGYVPSPETIYRGTRRLAPGELLVWERGRVSVERWWRLLERDAEPAGWSDAELDARLDALLGDAVERRLVADVPLGAFLSGGVDSSAVVALMQERAPKRVRTFSIGFREAGFDEAPYARAVAEHLGTEHTEWYLGRDDVVEVARELPRLYDEPFADASAIPTTLLSRLTRRHVTVALSGDGGDELFSGYVHHRRMAQLAPWLRLPRAARSGLAAGAALLPDGSLKSGLRHLASEDLTALALRLESHFDDELLAASCGADGARPAESFVTAFRDAPTDEPVRRLSFADAATYLVDDVLTKVDRASMSIALEVRVPILDHRVVRLVLSLPLARVWRGGRTKAPLRALAYRRLPPGLLERPKQGFAIPIHVLLAPEIEQWSASHLSPARLAEDGLFEPSAAARLVADARAQRSVPYRLWTLLCFQRWYAHTHRGERED